MLNYIKLNFKLMTKKKTFIVAFAVMLAIAIAFPFVTYIRYMKNFEFNMPAANSVFMANTFMQCWDYLVVIFPFLVVFPYAMSFYDENKLGVKFYIQTRGDRKKYYFSQIIVCFFGMFIIIAVSYSLNIILNSILFPKDGNDYLSTISRYSINYVPNILDDNLAMNVLSKGMSFKYLYINYLQIYNLIITLIAATVGGVMSVAAYVFSLFVRQGKVFILLFSFIVFEIFSTIDTVLVSMASKGKCYLMTSILNYMSTCTHSQAGKNYIYILLVMLSFVIAEILVVKRKIKEDEL